MAFYAAVVKFTRSPLIHSALLLHPLHAHELLAVWLVEAPAGDRVVLPVPQRAPELGHGFHSDLHH